MTSQRGWTLTELLIVLGIIVALVAILLPALGKPRRTARQMGNSTASRGIHQSLVTYAQANKGYFPGALATGTLNWDATQSLRGASIVRLADQGYFSAEYLISPGELDEAAIVGNLDDRRAGTEANPAPGGSFAVFDYRGGAQRAGAPLSTLGALEWRETLNPAAIILSDRQLTANPKSPRSIWAVKPDQWAGSLVFNDNHVSFEMTDKGYAGKYGDGAADPHRPRRVTGTINNLFDMHAGHGQMTVD